MTYLQLVNGVLRRLRESQVTSVAGSTYGLFIGELINETKREVEDAWEWVALRDTVQATTVIGNPRYYLNGVGTRFKLRSVYNDTTNSYLKLIDSHKMTELQNDAPVTAEPTSFDFAGLYIDDYQMDVYPVPDAEYILNINIINPQLDLSADSTELNVHEYPVLLGAYAKAVAERGDDNGLQYQVAYKAYQDALSDAIQLDARHNAEGTFDWHTDGYTDVLGFQ